MQPVNTSRLHIVLHNEIHSAFDVTTAPVNRINRIPHQSLRRAFRCAKQYASDCKANSSRYR